MIKSVDEIPYIHVMRYMGNKKKLLPSILERIYRLAEPGSSIIDLMAGTHCIGYALKGHYRIIANDVQRYTLPIGKALLSREPLSASRDEIVKDLENTYRENLSRPVFRFLQDNYGDTYFSPEQCAQLDSLRYSIEQVTDETKRAFYLTGLIKVACLAQSTPGHFAQFLPKDHRRVGTLRSINIWESFLEKSTRMFIQESIDDNILRTNTWREFFADAEIESLTPEISLVYIDPPYSREQYSRFYHLLETLVLYDCPTFAHKARYRDDRFKSDFCYPGRIEKEFSDMLETINNLLDCPVLLSYGSKGLLKKEQLLDICQKYFKEVELTEIDYAHSTLGKGIVADNKEYLISMKKA